MLLTLRLAIAAAFAAISSVALAVGPDFEAEADRILTSAYRAASPGAAVVVTEGGKVVYAGETGMADIAGGKPITPDTVFRMGSLTKQFAAAVVLQLVAEGKLALDDPLDKFVAGYPADKGGKATVRQLLNHTSGIQSYTGIPGWMAGDKPARAFTTAELIAEFRDQPVQFKPGERYSYNNSGYVLVGAVIEAVTGKPWWQAIDERIVKPLGLTSVRYGKDEAQVPGLAVGYGSPAPGVFAPARPLDMSVPSAAGALIGTARDFMRWSDALHHGKVVRADLYAEMIAPTKLTDGSLSQYGYGIGRAEIRGAPILTHSGGIFGFATNALYIPERDIAVVVFTNADSGMVPTEMPMLRIAAAALGKPFPAFTAIRPDVGVLEPLLGVYAIEGGSDTRTLYARGGRLFTRRGQGAETGVEYAGDNRFFYGPASLSWFDIVREGTGYAMRFHPNGADTAERAVRTGPVPASVQPAREVLESFAGRYTSAAAPFVVRMDPDGALSMAFGAQGFNRLSPLNETSFAIVGVDAQVEFLRTGGTVTGLVLRQGGRELPATRD